VGWVGGGNRYLLVLVEGGAKRLYLVNDHRLIDQRILAFGQAIAARLRRTARIDHAKANTPLACPFHRAPPHSAPMAGGAEGPVAECSNLTMRGPLSPLRRPRRSACPHTPRWPARHTPLRIALGRQRGIAAGGPRPCE